MTETLALIDRELSAAHRPCVTASFQTECVVLVHLLRSRLPSVPVLFLDTYHHFPETTAFAEALARDWSLNLVVLRAARPAQGLWQTSVDECCARHKVAPLFDALDAYDVWFAALRRDQSPTRRSLQTVEPFRLPSGHVLRKVSPLAGWSTCDIDAYVDRHGLPRLPLYARGYTSIGCAPCTTPPLDPANPRSGRWSGAKLECGIHIGAAGPQRGEPADG